MQLSFVENEFYIEISLQILKWIKYEDILIKKYKFDSAGCLMRELAKKKKVVK